MLAMLVVKSPQDLTAVATAMAEKAAAYCKAVAGIETETGAALLGFDVADKAVALALVQAHD